jgi:hypothetical protein
MTGKIPLFDGQFFTILAIVRDTEDVVTLAVSTSQQECFDYIQLIVATTGASCPFDAFMVERSGDYIPSFTDQPTHSGSTARN